MNTYYVYLYLREDDSPYYVGQGKDDRWKKIHSCEVPPRNRVKFLYENLTKEDACVIEMDLIDEYGRLNDGTGILENKTDGGEQGNLGMIHSEETKRIIAEKASRPRTEKSKIKQSISVSGENNHFFGKIHTEETKQKMRKPRTNLDGYTPEVRAERSRINSNTMSMRWKNYRNGEGPHPINGSWINKKRKEE